MFLEFVSKKNNGEKASFSSGYLGAHEGYKAAVYVRANDILLSETWDKKMIESGEIARRMDEAVHVKGNNFTGWRSKDNFRKIVREKPVEASQAIYNLFLENDDSAALEGIVALKGTRNYDLISTLFYMKNPDLYYPCKPRYFREAFEQLSLETDCFDFCSYSRYTKFNNEIRELADFFSSYEGHIDTLDAHSFAWVIGVYGEARAYIFDKDGELREPEAKTKPDSEKKEGLAQVKIRLKQSEYRKNLVEYWEGKCAVTGCKLEVILIASHAKPWRKCETNNECVSKYNGFLLTPNLDRLFDYGLISFDDNGKILISSEVTETEYESLGLRKDMRLGKVEEGHHVYLEYHRENVFRR